MNESNGGRFWKGFLYLLVGAISVSALLGVGSILSGRTGDWRILLTTLTVAGASVLSLGCSACLGGDRKFLPGVGLLASWLAAGLVIVGLWADLSSDVYWKATACISIVAVASVHAGLLSLTRLAPAFRWALPLAYGFLVLAAGQLLVTILWESPRGDWWARLLAVSLILDVSLTLLAAIFHRLSRTELLPAGNGLEALERKIARLEDELDELKRVRASLLGETMAEALTVQCAGR